jgi:hypothetical protein
MNEDKLGGYSTTGNNVLGTYSIGECWCGQSYFTNPSDGTGRVVTSGGNTIILWKVATSPAVQLTQVAQANIAAGVQDPGFFTSVSSNGKSRPIIWAISRPQSSTGSPLLLYAFSQDSTGALKQLFQGTAGLWPNLGGDSNLIPVVANGQVFVASNKQLSIFGLTQ